MKGVSDPSSASSYAFKPTVPGYPLQSQDTALECPMTFHTSSDDMVAELSAPMALSESNVCFFIDL